MKKVSQKLLLTPHKYAVLEGSRVKPLWDMGQSPMVLILTL
ncbi:MAG: hypothetical protein VB018_02750 [Lachnospiraceae bacterium]|nr:hypothetical protein [Lachnospiraceae bacterium]